MHAPAPIRDALKKHVTCNVCNAVRSNLYVRRTCKHPVCARCAPTSKTCPCGKRALKPPTPVDALTRDVLRAVFGRTPSDAQQRTQDARDEMAAQAHKIHAHDYTRRLDAELDALDDPVNAARCDCGLICVRGTALKNKRDYHGCPAWSKDNPAAACKFFQWLPPPPPPTQSHK